MVIFVVSWQFIPFHSLIYQGGVRQIPTTMYEAASIDGAGRVRQFFSITVPQLKYTIITSSTLMVVGSLTFFDLIFVLTAGGPGDATRVLALDMYKRGLPGQPDGPGQRDRRPPRAARPRAGPAAAPTRRQYDGQPAGRCVRWLWLPATPVRRPSPVRSPTFRARKLLGLNWFGGLAGWIWLVIVLVPLYWIVVTSFKDQSAYFSQNPFALPSDADDRTTTSWSSSPTSRGTS